ncbi:hypothetical protein ACIQFU_35085 [Streptomyces sp. NPDC093065]|uniref:hypothetical protein n=1 Tax=Streptomyces sp. NPDC093065 TaxID=3366021 RepID=UPI0037F4D7C1
MTTVPVEWPDVAESVIRGDLTVAVAYGTPAGGAVVTSVSPVGLADREAGRVGFTTSLGFPKKLDRILRDPRVSLAYHTREHGFAETNAYVLAQGTASVDLSPAPERLAELMAAAEPFLGAAPKGRLWDWLLREYHQERVFVDVHVDRIAVWPDLMARGPLSTTGPTWPSPPLEQEPPKNGTTPRVPVDALARRMEPLPHRVLAYQGSDGYPVVVPVAVTGHDSAGLRLQAAPGALPPGGRRAGFLAHAFNQQCVGLSMRTLTGWLSVTEKGARYAPHTSHGLAAPANKTLIATTNGLLAKYGLRQARRNGTLARLRELVGEATPSPTSRS